jgi:subtilisin family serine protease
MAEKEYIVSLNRGVDYDAFNNEMIASTGAGDIPNRTVAVENARPLSQRNTHYMLTDAEATALLDDARVYGVELRPEDRDDIEIGYDAQQFGSWRKTSADASTDLNWGMMRGIHREDVWNQEIETTLPFNYNLTGKGVDVVIQDSGLDVGHIEFTDSNGVSRVNQIDWFASSGVSGTQSANHYRDYDGHGTHVAGTAAGRTMGWAKDAQIYSVKINGLEGSGDSGTGISVSDCFDVIKGWHNAKPIDPETGVKRPTVVNMSWGYSFSSSSTPTAGVYRGASWNFGDANYSTDAELWATAGIVPKLNGTRKIGSRLTSVDTDVQEMIDAGIHICIAAGNSYYYIDNANGQDYNNTVTVSGSVRSYHQGSSPFDEEAFIVGNIDIDYTGNLENKAGSSCNGPGVNIYAPGTQIMSASSNDNASSTNDLAAAYNNRQAHLLDSNQYIFKISGTSMASPNVCGLLATVLEQNKGMTPAQAQAWVFKNSTPNKLNNGTVDDWDNTDSVLLTGNSVNYSSGSVKTVTELPPFTKELTVRGIKLLGHGPYDVSAKGISDTFLEKVARTVQLLLDPNASGIDKEKQAAAIDGMANENNEGNFGTGPTVQRIGYINGGQYARSFLDDDAPNNYPGLQNTEFSYRAKDYVWEFPDDDASGSGIADWDGYTVGGQVTEVLEHVLHTISQHGLHYAYPYELNITGGQIGSPMMTAMQEAIDNGVFNVSGYSGLYSPDSEVDLDEMQTAISDVSSGRSNKYSAYLNEIVSGRKRGDINNDGQIDIDDVMAFLSFKNGSANAYITDTIITPLTYNGYYAAIAREYQYLLCYAMWEYYSVYVDGGSLSPEWNDNSRTQAGVLTNNPLGYALFNNFISKVISKPTEATLNAMFAVSGASGYIPVENTNRILYTPFNSKDTLTVGNFTGTGTINIANK